MYENKKMDYDVILGLPWMKRTGAVIDAEATSLTFKHHNVTIAAELPQGNIHPISAAAFKLWHNRSKKTPHDQPKPEIFSVSMADIEKALKPKVHSDPRTKLPENIGNTCRCSTTKKLKSCRPCEEMELTTKYS